MAFYLFGIFTLKWWQRWDPFSIAIKDQNSKPSCARYLPELSHSSTFTSLVWSNSNTKIRQWEETKSHSSLDLLAGLAVKAVLTHQFSIRDSLTKAERLRSTQDLKSKRLEVLYCLSAHSESRLKSNPILLSWTD